MSNLWTIQKVLWKQYFLRHRTWFILLLLVAVILRVGQAQKTEDDFAGISVGVCVFDEDGKELFARLQGRQLSAAIQEEGIFRFALYEEEETMLRAVKNGSLECGYVLPEGFFENLSEGKLHRQITLYYSSSSGAHKLSYEVVFSHLLGMLSEDILEDWLAVSGIGEMEDSNNPKDHLLQLKRAYESGNETFSFSFERVGKENGKEVAVIDTVRGFVGIAIFFLAMLGLANCCELSKKTGAFSEREAYRIKQWSLHIAVAGSVLAGGLFMAVSGSFRQPIKELQGLCLYFIVLEVYLRILNRFLRTANAVYGAIPILLLGSILFCPVFFRLETFVTAASYLGKVFPVYWYLNIFT